MVPSVGRSVVGPRARIASGVHVPWLVILSAPCLAMLVLTVVTSPVVPEPVPLAVGQLIVAHSRPPSLVSPPPGSSAALSPAACAALRRQAAALARPASTASSSMVRCRGADAARFLAAVARN